MRKIRVLIVDDSHQVRHALKFILDQHMCIEVVGEASDANKAVQLVMELQPDVVLVDSQMPGVDGTETTRRIKEMTPQVKVLFMTVHEKHIDQALNAGADAYIFKDSGREKLLDAVKKLSSG